MPCAELYDTGPDEDIVLDSNTDSVEDELESHSVKGKTSQQASPQPWQSRVVLPPSHGEGVGNQDETATRDSIDIIAIQVHVAQGEEGSCLWVGRVCLYGCMHVGTACLSDMTHLKCPLRVGNTILAAT